jgi:hypothetical protein
MWARLEAMGLSVVETFHGQIKGSIQMMPNDFKMRTEKLRKCQKCGMKLIKVKTDNQYVQFLFGKADGKPVYEKQCPSMLCGHTGIEHEIDYGKFFPRCKCMTIREAFKAQYGI